MDVGKIKKQFGGLIPSPCYMKFKKYFNILLKILFYPVFILSSLFFALLIFNLLIYIPLNAIFIEMFEIDISFGDLGKKLSGCDIENSLTLFFIYSLIFFVFYLISQRDIFKKAIKYFALVSAVLNLAFVVMVIVATQTEWLKPSGCSWLYFKWFNEWWRMPFTVITSLIISYFCLSVYSEKLYIPLPEKIREKFIRMKTALFYILVNSYFILYIIFVNLWITICPCPPYLTPPPRPKYKGHSAMIISHSMGIYGFATNHLLECKTGHIIDQCDSNRLY